MENIKDWPDLYRRAQQRYEKCRARALELKERNASPRAVAALLAGRDAELVALERLAAWRNECMIARNAWGSPAPMWTTTDITDETVCDAWTYQRELLAWAARHDWRLRHRANQSPIRELLLQEPPAVVERRRRIFANIHGR